MANPFFEPPSTPAGTPEDQLRQVYGYLYQMSLKLNESLNAVTMEQLDTDTQNAIRSAGQAEETGRSGMTALKSLIIKTAEIVRNEMDVIHTELNGKFESISGDFGEYERTLHATIEATAEGIMQDYLYGETVAGDAISYASVSRQYIYSGLLSDDPEPVYGIAIGKDITDANGELVEGNRFATFTAEELAFYVNGIKVSWFSNSTMFIDRAQLMTSLQMGNHEWRVLAGGSMALINNKQPAVI